METKECEFCLGENWDEEETERNLEYVKYKYNTDEYGLEPDDTYEGMMCRRCATYLIDECDVEMLDGFYVGRV